MGVKIIFSDIDGTFLTEDHRVTDQTAWAVKELLSRGIPFVLVSARMPEAIYPITDRMGIRIPVISYSGALVLTEDGSVLYNKTLPETPCREVLRAIRDRWPMVTVNYYAGRTWYVQSVDPYVQKEMEITGASAVCANFSTLMGKGEWPNKILVMAEPAMCEEMEDSLGKEFPGLHVVRSSAYLLEIMDRSVSKASGVEAMLKHFGWKAEDAVGFGDNYNDAEMLAYVG